MPYTNDQVKAIAAQANRKLGSAGAKRYMHKLKQEAVRKHGYFIKDGKGKRKIKRKKKSHD